jgi:dehydrogenase/reductase SDR family member 7B
MLHLYVLILHFCHFVKLALVDPIFFIGGCVYVLFRNKEEELKSFYSGKNVLVTGASSGIGEAMCRRLAALGANVILTARNLDRLNEVANACRLIAPEGKFIVVQLDLEQYSAINVDLCETMFVRKLSALGLGDGGIDVAVLNAGLSCRGSVSDTELATIEKLMATNFFGSAALAKGLLPHFLQRRRGSFAIISSVQGKIGMPLRSAYAASKFAVQGFFDSMRAEVACKNINILTVSPGYVRTALSLNAVNGDGSSYGKLDETTAKGMDPMVLCNSVLEGICDGKQDLVVADSKTVLGIQLNALMPELFTQMVKLKN